MEIKNELLLKRVEDVAKDVFEKINRGYDDIDYLPFFEYKGFAITVPIFDETLRDSVDPIEYYGEENIIEYIEDAIKKDFL
ncbi:MAG: hypothetical protein ACQEQF_00155 [Bacillota bacterium]